MCSWGSFAKLKKGECKNKAKPTVIASEDAIEDEPILNYGDDTDSDSDYIDYAKEGTGKYENMIEPIITN